MVDVLDDATVRVSEKIINKINGSSARKVGLSRTKKRDRKLRKYSSKRKK